MDIVNQISINLLCDGQTAQEYLEAEVRHLQELQELNDLREDDLYMACSNLGIEDDYVEYLSTVWLWPDAQKLNDMTYFQNISSLADLEKKYRRLAIDNHPDKGGSTETMQRINSEFEKLFAVWKDVPVSPASDFNGYENDYGGASAGEYTQYVYKRIPVERQQLRRTVFTGNRADNP